MATRPYPRELEQTADLNGLQVLLRPIRPEDAPAYAELVERSGAEDLRMRFFTLVRRLPPRELARYTRIDYDRDMAFVAVSPQANGEILGEIRLYTYPDGDTAEFAILVRTDMQRRGLGRALLAKAMDYLRARGTATLIGQIRDDNEPMLALARRCGMEIELPPGGTLAIAHLDLRTAAEQARAPRRYDATPGAHTTMTALTKDHRDRLAAQLAERKQVLLGEIRAGLTRMGDERYADLLSGTADAGDESVARLLSDVTGAEVERDAAELRDILAAEERLRAGTYGTCIDCGGQIPVERLSAYPTAKRCLDCQRIREATRR